MGYTILDIADISRQPNEFSLSANTNFIEFRSKADTETTQIKGLKLTLTYMDNMPESASEFTVHTVLNGSFTFIGTRDKAKLNSTTFFINDDVAATANNIMYCLLNNDFISSNYSISNLLYLKDGKMSYSNSLLLTPYSKNQNTFITIIPKSDSLTTVSNFDFASVSKDSINSGLDDCNIEIDIYENPTRIKQDNEQTIEIDSLGRLLTSLQKNYYGSPCWFDLNSILGFTRPDTIDFLNTNDWVNTQSVRSYRFVAKRNTKANHEPFYISDILYCVCGYSRGLEDIDMSQYVYDPQEDYIIKPLTNQPTLFHTKGQTQYFNFLLKDKLDTNYTIGLNYRLYTQSRRLIASIDGKEQSSSLLGISNTVNTELDTLIEDYPKTGYVEICLTINGTVKSEPLCFIIQPQCLHNCNDYVFLNSLGGWSTLNFGNGTAQEFKPGLETYHQTKAPESNISSTLEGVYSKSVTETHTVTSSPLTAEMCEYFKEIATSVSVYELSTKRYIIVEDLTIKTNSKDELYNLDMKFRYSDKYNGI